MSSPEAREDLALAGGIVDLAVAGTGFEPVGVGIVQQALGSEAEEACVCESSIAGAWGPSLKS